MSRKYNNINITTNHTISCNFMVRAGWRRKKATKWKIPTTPILFLTIFRQWMLCVCLYVHVFTLLFTLSYLWNVNRNPPEFFIFYEYDFLWLLISYTKCNTEYIQRVLYSRQLFQLYEYDFISKFEIQPIQLFKIFT